MIDFAAQRAQMVATQLLGRGIADRALLEAFSQVPREEFVPAELAEFAYDDTPLPIGAGQTISQPYIVALSLETLDLRGNERVLEVGTGSGYAAALLAMMAREVHSIERVGALAEAARERLARLGYANVHVIHGDGSLGWPDAAPYDAIAVAAVAPRAPEALLEQLAVGGRLVMPIRRGGSQVLVRITREDQTRFEEEYLADVRFVPLIGEQGFEGDAPSSLPRPPSSSTRALSALIREAAERLDDIADADVDALLDRIGDARLVLLGEATHGTSEFYRMRARISQELIRKRGFQFVAVEADWPDAARIHDYVLGQQRDSRVDFTPFSRFPTWMWRNREVFEFVAWLRAHNATASGPRVGFHGLDLYSMFTSIAAVLAYLDDVDPEAARVARHRYGTLTPWQKNPAAYGQAVLVGRYESSEAAVVAMLQDMLKRRLDYAARGGERLFDAAQNARVVQNAERYYRCMYYGAALSWNLRDSHMFETLSSLCSYYGPGAKGIVWEHNSHIGDARATSMRARGEHNVGQLCREQLGDAVYLVGFGTDHGSVAAARDWGEEVEHMRLRAARQDSYESLFHESGVPAFLLHLRDPVRRAVRHELMARRLERAIGVVYRPETELESHYFEAELPRQFDEYVWFDETRAVSELPVAAGASPGPADTYPFGL